MWVQRSESTTTGRNQGPRRTSCVGDDPWSAGSVKAASSRKVEGDSLVSGDRIQISRRKRGIEIQQRSQPRYHYEGRRGTPSSILARGNPIKFEAAPDTETDHEERMHSRSARNSGGSVSRKRSSYPPDSSMCSVRAASSRVVRETAMVSGDRIQTARRERGIRDQQMPQSWNRDGVERGVSSAISNRRNPVKLETPRKSKKGRAQKISGQGSPNVSLKAPRYENTLFDHLLKSNIKFDTTPKQPISGDKLHPKTGDSDGTRQISACALDHSPLKTGMIAILPSTTISPPAFDGIDNAAGRALANDKCENTGVKTQGHSKPRVAGNKNAILNPGKQRIGPRKKKLSVLKKRILLHRAEQWGHQMPSTSLEAKRSTESSSAAPNDQHWVVNIRNLVEKEDVEDEEERAEIERDIEKMASEFGVVVRVEVPQATAMVGTPHEEPVPVAVVFSNAKDAKKAREGFHGIVVGGSTLEVEVAAGECVEGLESKAEAVFSNDSVNEFPTKGAKGLQGCPASATGSGAPCSPIKDTSTMEPPARRWLVSVKNFMDIEDDLEDDDEYAEICADATRIVGACSRPISVDIPRPNGEDGSSVVGDITATFASKAEAERCVAKVCGQWIGGKELFAELIVDSPKGEANVGSIGEVASATGGCWQIVVKNLIDQEDLVEDEEYAEVRSDVASMASEYGSLLALLIPRTETELGAEVGEAVAVFASLEEARACARGLGSRTVGGKRLEATILSSPWVKGGQTVEGDSQEGLRSQHGDAFPPNFARLSEQKLPVGATQAGHNGGVAPVQPGTDANESGGGDGGSSKGLAGAPLRRPFSSREKKRFPDKYKEICGLPRHPASSGWKPKAYMTQVL